MAEKVYCHIADFCTYVVSVICDLLTSIYDRIIAKDNTITSDNHSAAAKKSKIDNFLQDSQQLIESIKIDQDEFNILNVGRQSIVYQGIFTDPENNKQTSVAIKKMNKTNNNNTEKNFREEVYNLLKVQQDSRFTQIIAAYTTSDSYYIVTNNHGIDAETYMGNLIETGQKEAFFKKHFESQLKDNPEMPESGIESLRDFFTDMIFIFNKGTVLTNLDSYVSYLQEDDIYLSPSCFITLIDAWINCVKTEYEYKDPLLNNIPTFKKH